MLSLFCAPLQGFTDAAFRIAHAKFSGGISAYYTPFLRLEKGKIRPKDLRDLEWDLQTKKDFPYHLIPQIIAKDAFEFRSLVEQILPLGVSEIDLNAGCPFPMQTKSGRGAGLLLHPENFFEILDAMEEFPQVQFSIKMRLGENSESEIFEILPRLNVSNLSQITLHPRLGIDEYHGEIRLDAFQRFYENCSRPMVLNGDIFTAEKIRECAEKFPKLKGVMLGRGLLRNPNLAREYAENFTGKTAETLFKMHAEIFAQYKMRYQGDAQILEKIRPFWAYADLPKKMAKKIAKAKTLAEYENCLIAIGEL